MSAYFASAIRIYRTALGISETDAARRLGVSVQRLQALELGSAQPTQGEAKALSTLLNIPLNVLRDLRTFDRDGLPLTKGKK